ncbi:hypothetical protein GGX14DRAFT_424983, partial [Mycena pura]
MAPAKRRVSYIIPPPTDPVIHLDLPKLSADRVGRVGPLLCRSSNQPSQDQDHSAHIRHPRHRLGVAALALDTSTHLAGRPAPEGILYTGGRDGLVLSWDLGLSLRRRTVSDSIRRRGRWEALTGWADDAIDEEAEEADDRPTSDGDILGDVTASRRRVASSAHELPYEDQWELDSGAIPSSRAARFASAFKRTRTGSTISCSVTTIRPVSLISASSDGTVQAWTPHAAGSPNPSTVGTHSDYVRCLAACRTQNWIASGSFDRSIKLWDLTRSQINPDPLITLQPADAHSPKCSVYAVAADPFGHAVASGGPERVVRLWDPRTGKRSGKLVGHTDNIRAILLSEDAKYLLTGSADASIKLWSLATQRCLHTFTHHADSVWSLFSAHPSLEIFYAGDRAGLVSRVDVSRLTDDVGEGECVLVCRDVEEGVPDGVHNQGQGGINKLVVSDDSLVWTATSASSVRRWCIPPRGSMGTGTGTSTRRMSRSEFEVENEREGRSVAPSIFSYDGEDGDEGDTRHGIPYASLVRLTSPIDPFPIRGGRDHDAEVATLYSAASVVSVPPLRSPLHSASPHIGSPSRGVPLPNSRGAYFSRELAADAQPLALKPDLSGTLAGERGLVRALVLNDRVHAVSIDTGGEVGVWDLVRGICVGVIPREALGWNDCSGGCALETAVQEWSPREVLERVRQRIEGEAVVAPWATVDTKSGVLAVHLNERSFESEIYADEVGLSGDRRFGDEAKLNIGKWVLRNLFLGFIKEELRVRRVRRDSTHSQDTMSSVHRASVSSDTSSRHRHSSLTNESRRRSSNSTVVSAPKMVPAVLPAVSAAPPGTSPLLTPMIQLPVRGKEHIPMPSILGSPVTSSNDMTPMPQPQRRSRVGETDGKEGNDYFASRPRRPSDEFSGWSGPGATGAQIPSTPTSLMGRLKSFGRKRALDVVAPSLPTTVESPVIKEAAPEPVAKTPVQLLLAGPLSPPPSSEAPTLVLSPHILLLIEEEAEPGFTTVYRGTVASTGTDTHALEEAMPLWLIEYLLLHRMPSTPPQIKLSFILLPWVDKDNIEDQLPELLNTCALSVSIYFMSAHV